MDNQSLSAWVQILTASAILIGLALVVWELQQARTLARLQLSSNGWSEVSADKRTMLGDEFAKTFAKACVGSDLNHAETIEIVSYLDLLMDRNRRARDMDRVEQSSGASWEQLSARNLRNYLSIPLGRADFDVHKKSWDPAFREIAEKQIQEGIPICTEGWLLNDRPSSTWLLVTDSRGCPRIRPRQRFESPLGIFRGSVHSA